MLARIQADKLKQLAAVNQLCVSILMKTHTKGPQTQQGPIRLKNLLEEAKQQLEEKQFDSSLLNPLSDKIHDYEFWQHQGNGLAVYLTAESCHWVRLDDSPSDRAYVADHFYLKPLIAAEASNQRYLVLALSWDDARLFRGMRQDLQLIETAALPATFEELVLKSDPEEQLQFTSHRSVQGSAALYHGHGEGEDSIEGERRQYLSRVGSLVAEECYHQSSPLVLLATEEVAGHFQAVADVSIAQTVHGSPSELTDIEIADRAAAAISPQQKAEVEEFRERFGAALARGRGSNDIVDIVAAAREGRVETLMIAEGIEAWDSDQQKGRELTNEAVRNTLNTGGEILSVDGDAMPDEAAALAIYRY